MALMVLYLDQDLLIIRQCLNLDPDLDPDQDLLVILQCLSLDQDQDPNQDL